MQQIVLATGNAGKVRELAAMVSRFGLSIVPQTELGVGDVAETGLTFVENALIKARYAALITGLPAIADDSGLEVDFLNGQPGIYSARYAGPQANDRDNVNKLLDALAGVADDQRQARFQCVLVYLRHAADPTPLICQGTWEGRITLAPSGSNGFGYDPVFWVPSEGCTSAQLPAERKNLLSHRGQALAALAAVLESRR